MTHSASAAAAPNGPIPSEAINGQSDGERMMRFAAMLASVVILGLSNLAQAQREPSPQDRQTMDAANAAYDAMPDTPGTGHYAAIKLADPGLPDHLVYRPSNLNLLGSRKLGVMVWGNGGCSDDAAGARLHLAEIASHGYLVIAPGRALTGPGAPPRPTTPDTPKPLGIRTNSAQVSAGIDWALAENRRPDSALYRKIDPRMIAVAGHSCGGLQAIQVGADRRIRTVIVHNSGVFKDGGNPIKGLTIDKSALLKLHTPVLYIMGGQTDVAWPNGNDDFEKIEHVPVAIASLEVGHGGTFRNANGGPVARIDVAWLDWQLRGDQTASRWFRGRNCGLCTDRSWTFRSKNIDRAATISHLE